MYYFGFGPADQQFLQNKRPGGHDMQDYEYLYHIDQPRSEVHGTNYKCNPIRVVSSSPTLMPVIGRTPANSVSSNSYFASQGSLQASSPAFAWRMEVVLVGSESTPHGLGRAAQESSLGCRHLSATEKTCAASIKAGFTGYTL